MRPFLARADTRVVSFTVFLGCMVCGGGVHVCTRVLGGQEYVDIRQVGANTEEPSDAGVRCAVYFLLVRWENYVLQRTRTDADAHTHSERHAHTHTHTDMHIHHACVHVRACVRTRTRTLHLWRCVAGRRTTLGMWQTR